MASECTAGNHPSNADGVTLCHKCTTILEEDLHEVGPVWEDLQTTVQRRDVGAPSVGGGGHTGSQPPVNLDAMDKAQTLRITLGGWASHLPQLHPFGEPPVIAAWLLGQIPEIRKQPWAGDLVRELRESLNECRYATDRAAEHISLGQCWEEIGETEEARCQGQVTAVAGALYGRCRTCGAKHEVHGRQQWLISEAWHAAAPLPVVIRALKQVGTVVKPKDAENWVSRGKVIACIHEDGGKTYQLKAMRKVHEEMQAKRARRATRENLSSTA